MDVAHALMRAVSKLFSTPWWARDSPSSPSVGMSAQCGLAFAKLGIALLLGGCDGQHQERALENCIHAQSRSRDLEDPNGLEAPGSADVGKDGSPD